MTDDLPGQLRDHIVVRGRSCNECTLFCQSSCFFKLSAHHLFLLGFHFTDNLFSPNGLDFPSVFCPSSPLSPWIRSVDWTNTPAPAVPSSSRTLPWIPPRNNQPLPLAMIFQVKTTFLRKRIWPTPLALSLTSSTSALSHFKTPYPARGKHLKRWPNWSKAAFAEFALL